LSPSLSATTAAHSVGTGARLIRILVVAVRAFVCSGTCIQPGFHIGAGLVFNGILPTEGASQDRRRLESLVQDDRPLAFIEVGLALAEIHAGAQKANFLSIIMMISRGA